MKKYLALAGVLLALGGIAFLLSNYSALPISTDPRYPAPPQLPGYRPENHVATDTYSIDRDTNISWYDRLTMNKLSTIDTTLWDTYTNDTYGFEVKYPETWTIEEDVESTMMLSISLNDELLLTISTSSPLRLESVDGGHVSKKEIVTLNGISWTGVDLQSEGVMLALEAQRNDLFYTFWDTFFTQDYSVATAVIKSLRFTR